MMKTKRPVTLSTTISKESREILKEVKMEDIKVNVFIDRAIQNEYKIWIKRKK